MSDDPFGYAYFSPDKPPKQSEMVVVATINLTEVLPDGSVYLLKPLVRLRSPTVLYARAEDVVQPKENP